MDLAALSFSEILCEYCEYPPRNCSKGNTLFSGSKYNSPPAHSGKKGAGKATLLRNLCGYPGFVAVELINLRKRYQLANHAGLSHILDNQFRIEGVYQNW